MMATESTTHLIDLARYYGVLAIGFLGLRSLDFIEINKLIQELGTTAIILFTLGYSAIKFFKAWRNRHEK